MGQLVSRVRPGGGGRGGGEGRRRRRDGVDEDGDTQQTYSTCASERKSYFGAHFLMGGERYELAKPEAFLFGENSDLDLLGDKPVAFPYARQQVTDPVRPLNLFVNIRKESIKFTRVPKDDEADDRDRYRIEFIFDADHPCYIQIHFNVREHASDTEIQFIHRDFRHIASSEKYFFETGCDQHFNNFIFDSSQYDLSKLQYSGGAFYPVVIAVHTQDDKQLQTTAATVECAADRNQQLLLKPLRQKIAFDGVVYLLQEIFGLENKEQHDMDENGFECIICMSEVRDTVILPCRHLCLCNGCAEALRYKLNNCPICRSPFRALIQIKALRMVNSVSITDTSSTAQPRSQTRWETLSLVEALNGPLSHMQPCVLGGTPAATVEVHDEESGGGLPSSVSANSSFRPARTRSTRIHVQKVVGKQATDEARETEEGIELSSAEYFQHRPVNVVVVQPAHSTKLRTSTTSESSKSDTESSSTENCEMTAENLKKAEEKEREEIQIASDPSSTDSQDSANALLSK